jgi:hypothetical protein
MTKSPHPQMVVKEHFSTIQECLDWVNDELLGRIVPDLPDTNLFVSQIEQFQIIMHSGNSYTIVVLISIFHQLPVRKVSAHHG